jgi:hypothetical protein
VYGQEHSSKSKVLYFQRSCPQAIGIQLVLQLLGSIPDEQSISFTSM